MSREFRWLVFVGMLVFLGCYACGWVGWSTGRVESSEVRKAGAFYELVFHGDNGKTYTCPLDGSRLVYVTQHSYPFVLVQGAPSHCNIMVHTDREAAVWSEIIRKYTGEYHDIVPQEPRQ